MSGSESDYMFPQFAPSSKRRAPSLSLNTQELETAIRKECNVQIADGVWRGKNSSLRAHKTLELKIPSINNNTDKEAEEKKLWSDDEIFADEFIELKDAKLLGVGSSARVVKALHRKTSKLVALKKVRSFDSLNQAETEMAAMCLLPENCPQLVNLLAFWRDPEEEELVLALEYCDLGSIKDYLKVHGPLKEKMCRWIARELCKGLKALHDKNLIHRDIKPANVLLSTSSSIKICDFGLLYQLDSRDGVCTKAAGTLKYFSPERLEKAYGTKSDVWALGVVIYECARGKKGVLAPTCDLEQELRINDDSFALAEHHSKLFKDFLSRCLEKDPAKRWSCDALLAHPWLKLGANHVVYFGAPTRKGVDQSERKKLPKRRPRSFEESKKKAPGPPRRRFEPERNPPTLFGAV